MVFNNSLSLALDENVLRAIAKETEMPDPLSKQACFVMYPHCCARASDSWQLSEHLSRLPADQQVPQASTPATAKLHVVTAPAHVAIPVKCDRQFKPAFHVRATVSGRGTDAMPLPVSAMAIFEDDAEQLMRCGQLPEWCVQEVMASGGDGGDGCSEAGRKPREIELKGKTTITHAFHGDPAGRCSEPQTKEYTFPDLEFARGTRMKRVYFLFACSPAPSSFLVSLFTVPCISLARADQRPRATTNLGLDLAIYFTLEEYGSKGFKFVGSQAAPPRRTSASVEASSPPEPPPPAAAPAPQPIAATHSASGVPYPHAWSADSPGGGREAPEVKTLTALTRDAPRKGDSFFNDADMLRAVCSNCPPMLSSSSATGAAHKAPVPGVSGLEDIWRYNVPRTYGSSGAEKVDIVPEARGERDRDPADSVPAMPAAPHHHSIPGNALLHGPASSHASAAGLLDMPRVAENTTTARGYHDRSRSGRGMFTTAAPPHVHYQQPAPHSHCVAAAWGEVSSSAINSVKSEPPRDPKTFWQEVDPNLTDSFLKLWVSEDLGPNMDDPLRLSPSWLRNSDDLGASVLEPTTVEGAQDFGSAVDELRGILDTRTDQWHVHNRHVGAQDHHS